MGLRYLGTKNIIHTDIKPANLFLKFNEALINYLVPLLWAEDDVPKRGRLLGADQLLAALMTATLKIGDFGELMVAKPGMHFSTSPRLDANGKQILDRHGLPVGDGGVGGAMFRRYDKKGPLFFRFPGGLVTTQTWVTDLLVSQEVLLRKKPEAVLRTLQNNDLFERQLQRSPTCSSSRLFSACGGWGSSFGGFGPHPPFFLLPISIVLFLL